METHKSNWFPSCIYKGGVEVFFALWKFAKKILPCIKYHGKIAKSIKCISLKIHGNTFKENKNQKY